MHVKNKNSYYTINREQILNKILIELLVYKACIYYNFWHSTLVLYIFFAPSKLNTHTKIFSPIT